MLLILLRRISLLLSHVHWRPLSLALKDTYMCYSLSLSLSLSHTQSFHHTHSLSLTLPPSHSLSLSAQMLSGGYFGVISPEGAASILGRYTDDAHKAVQFPIGKRKTHTDHLSHTHFLLLALSLCYSHSLSISLSLTSFAPFSLSLSFTSLSMYLTFLSLSLSLSLSLRLSGFGHRSENLRLPAKGKIYLNS